MQIDLQLQTPTGMNGMNTGALTLIKHVASHIPIKKQKTRALKIKAKVRGAAEWLDKWIPNWKYAPVKCEEGLSEVNDDE